MLKLADIRRTTRRAGDARVVYPRLLRDRALAPRIEMATRYLESMLGHARRELDDEVVVQLFGDHKLARCVVACLGASYRHRPRAFAEVLPAAQAAALAARGLTDASTLRLWLFRRVNKALAGFASHDDRPAFLRAAAADLGISPLDLDTLLSLDAPERAMLVRQGPKPTPDDIIARFNYETLAALLANAVVVRIALQRQPDDPDAIRALAEAASVRADLARRELALTGQQDVFGSWARHGARLVRLVSALLAAGLPARSAEAQVAAPDGSIWLLRLDRALLGYLGAPEDAHAAHYTPAALLDGWRAADAFLADFAMLRRHQLHDGWALRRAREPLLLGEGSVPALFVATRGNQRVTLALAPTTAAGWQRLGTLAARGPLVALAVAGEDADSNTLPPDAPVLALRYGERADLLPLPELLARAAGEAERRAGRARLDALLDEAAAAGVLIESLLAQRLNCRDEELPARLATPAMRAALQRRALHYIEGFGLCTAAMLARAQDATSDDVAHLRANPAVGSAWLLRVLGRKLREVTGASEGIECLIAYLSAA